MKRYGNLFEKICDIDNLRLAHKNASKGKSKYSEVKNVTEDMLQDLKTTLLESRFNTSPYTIFTKLCGNKERTIYRLPYYPDRIVQHAILQIVEPILVKTFIRDTFQSIKGRGTSDCRRRVKKAVYSSGESTYVLKLDINKFYPSVNNTILKQLVRKKIKCVETLHLLDNIVDSTAGLPIGNYTSQILGNLYLSGLDHYIKESLSIKHYFRYCDDLVVLGTKAECRHALVCISEYLENLNLTIKRNWQIFHLDRRPLDFIGYVFSRGNIRLRKSIVKRFSNKTKHFSRDPTKYNRSSVMAYWGLIKPIGAHSLWAKHTR